MEMERKRILWKTKCRGFLEGGGMVQEYYVYFYKIEKVAEI